LIGSKFGIGKAAQLGGFFLVKKFATFCGVVRSWWSCHLSVVGLAAGLSG
jgi:hypothetical protein